MILAIQLPPTLPKSFGKEQPRLDAHSRCVAVSSLPATGCVVYWDICWDNDLTISLASKILRLRVLSTREYYRTIHVSTSQLWFLEHRHLNWYILPGKMYKFREFKSCQCQCRPFFHSYHLGQTNSIVLFISLYIPHRIWNEIAVLPDAFGALFKFEYWIRERFTTDLLSMQMD